MNTLLFILIPLFLLAGLGLFSQSKNIALLAAKARRLIALLKRDWWIKITTDAPLCTYYFGPFDTLQEARGCQNGYVEDLQNEGALGISSHIQRIRPQTLTLEESY